ncbi:Na-translocating system protein MpsC family protein [Chitinispirillales bacterium ANBcel5]|uniref:Na-translocating system protein MpsC family protein n=1 Tax=Cellulosispirillum alkaliphilum TaxID=3039283 RepID=UPI002A5466A9|nr:Na-translocating system protein MpsC family protein [Chitinispirillales bacterium ANBcel5]
MMEGNNSTEKDTESLSSIIAREVCSYGSEQMGIYPKKVSVDVHEQSVTVTLEGVSHPAELELAKKQLSRSMIQEMYTELFNVSNSVLHSRLENNLDKTVIRSFFTVDPQYGSAVIVLFFGLK